jgi:amidophosphoribosyltransferase
MSDSIHHECGIAMIRLLKPLEFYLAKYGTAFYGLHKLHLLMRKQMTSVQMPVPVLQAPTGTPATAVTPVPGNATQQSQQIQQQYKQALEAATQARPMPDNDK